MFDDFFSSARGPGLIGMLLALVVVVGLCALFMSASTSGPSLETQVRDQRALITNTKRKIEDDSREISKMEAYQAERTKLKSQGIILANKKKEIAESTEAREAVEKSIQELQTKHDLYRQRYRNAERQRAEGEKIDLSSTMGDAYREVTISRVDPIEMGVRTKNGPKRIPWQKLPPKLQDRFQFDEIEAAAHMEKVRIAAEEQDKAIAASNAAQAEVRAEENMRKAEEKRRMDELKVQNLLIAAEGKEDEADSYRRQAKEARAQHNEARRRGNTSMHLGKASEYDRKADAAEAMARKYHQAANQLEARLRSER